MYAADCTVEFFAATQEYVVTGDVAAQNPLLRAYAFCVDPAMREVRVRSGDTYKCCTLGDALAKKTYNIVIEKEGAPLAIIVSGDTASPWAVRNDRFGDFLVPPRDIAPRFLEVRLPLYSAPIWLDDMPDLKVSKRGRLTTTTQIYPGQRWSLRDRVLVQTEHGDTPLHNRLKVKDRDATAVSGGAPAENQTYKVLPFTTNMDGTDPQLCMHTWANRPDAFAPYFFHGYYMITRLKLGDVPVFQEMIRFCQVVAPNEEIILVPKKVFKSYKKYYQINWTYDALRADLHSPTPE